MSNVIFLHDPDLVLTKIRTWNSAASHPEFVGFYSSKRLLFPVNPRVADHYKHMLVDADFLDP